MSELNFPGEIVEQRASVKETPPEKKPAEQNLISRGTIVGSLAMTGSLAGAHYGAAMGAAGGPPGVAIGALAGGTVGGILGAMEGSFLDDAKNYISKKINNEPTETSAQYLTRATKNALREAGYDFAFSAGAGVIGKATSRLGKPLMGKLLGARSEEALARQAAAHGQGIDVGTAHVTRFGFIKGMTRTFGVFPLIGKPFVEGQKRVVGQMTEKAADLLNTIAPKTMEFEVGAEMVKGAKARYDKFVNIKGALYDRFAQIADNLSVPDVVPTDAIRMKIAGIASEEAKETVTLATGEAMQRFKNDEFGLFLSQLSELPDYLTVRQARGLQRELNEIAQTSKFKGYDVSRMGILKDALVDAIQNIDTSRLPAEEATRVTHALQRANAFFHEGRKIFETKTAKKMGRFETNMFEAGVSRPGTINADDVFRTVLESKNPAAIADLRKLIGNNPFRKVAREHIQNAVEASMVIPKEGSAVGVEMFSAQKFEKVMRLDTEEGWAALKEMLKTTGSDYRQWANFLSAAKVGSDIVLRDPSEFIKRRMVLSGLTGGAIAGSLFAGAGHISLPSAAFLTWVARKAAKKLMDPVFLRDITMVIADRTPNIQKRNAMVRILDAIPKGDSNERHDENLQEQGGDGSRGQETSVRNGR